MELPSCAIGGITAANCAPLVQAGPISRGGRCGMEPSGGTRRRRARAERCDRRSAMMQAILTAHADPDQPGATFRAIDASLAGIPVTSCSQSWCTTRHCGSPSGSIQQARCLPIVGRKPVTDSARMQQVMPAASPISVTRVTTSSEFLRPCADRLARLREHPEHACALARSDDGTLNLCHRAGFYGERPPQLALPALLMITRS